MEEKRIVKPWQAGLMLLVGIAVIIVGLLVMKLNNRIVLALDGVIMCLMRGASAFRTPSSSRASRRRSRR